MTRIDALNIAIRSLSAEFLQTDDSQAVLAIEKLAGIRDAFERQARAQVEDSIMGGQECLAASV